MAKTVFIIGNGFDLDLEFRTKYSDYYKISELNNFWPFKDSSSGLGGYINKCAKTEKWLDLEMALFNYASSTSGNAVLKGGSYPLASDKYDFDVLRSNITSFIKRIPSETKINKESIASLALKAVLNSRDYSIYSFNYTNLRSIAARLYNDKPYVDAEYDLEYTPIHGTVAGNDIILGVHSDSKLIDGYEFLRKIDQPFYRSNNLQQDLLSAKNVIFFGLSMGIIDYPYFRALFERLSNGVIHSEEKKRITFFTYDEHSRLQILRQLRDLTGTDLMMLKSNSFLTMIRTSCCGNDDKQIFLNWRNQL